MSGDRESRQTQSSPAPVSSWHRPPPQASPQRAASAQLQASPLWAMQAQKERPAKREFQASSRDETTPGTHPRDTSAHAAADRREQSAPAHFAAPYRTTD